MINKRKVTRMKLFLFTFLSGIKFNFGGSLAMGEIIAFFDCLNINSWKKIYKELIDLKKIHLALLVILISQIISDITNNSTFHDSIRGWANVIMTILVTLFLSKILVKSLDLIVFYFLGEIFRYLFFNVEVVKDSIFSIHDMGFLKFRLVPILNIVILISACYTSTLKNKPKYVVYLFLFYGIFCLMFDARSNGVFMILTGIILFYKKYLINYSSQKAYSLLFVFFVGFQSLYLLYVNQALAGNIGGEHTQLQLKRIENPYNPLNLLFSGRTEVFVAFKAIADKPIFGHGSWAPDITGKYNAMSYELHNEQDKFARLLQANGTKNFIIPSHSVIFGTWMTGGIAAFCGVLAILVLFLKRCLSLMRSREVIYSKYFPILVFFMINAFWIFLFSPLPEIKSSLPIMLSFVIVMYKKVQDKKRQQIVNEL